MAQVIIRNLEESVVSALKSRAAVHGHSLEQELRDIVTQAARRTRDEVLAAMDRLRSLTPPGAHPDSTDLLREDRQR